MKDYFNKDEQVKHLIMLSCVESVKGLANCEAVSNEEKKWLKSAITYMTKCSDSIFERMGSPYRRKLENTMKANKIKLVGNYESVQKSITECASQDLEDMLQEIQPTHCLICNGDKDYRNCGMYAMCVAVGYEETKDYNGKGCPFKVE